MSKKIFHLSYFAIMAVMFLYSSVLAQSIDDGKKLLRNESFIKAVETFRTIAGQSNTPEAWYYLGETYFEKKVFDSAKIAFQKGIEVKPDYGLNYTGLAKVIFSSKNITDGEKNIAEALKIADDKDVKLIQAVSEAYIKGGKDLSVKAKDLLDQAINLTKKAKKKDQMNYILLGDMYNVENNGSAAVENYKKAIDIDSSSQAFVSIGKIFEIIKNYGEAELSYNQAIKVDPAYSRAYKGLAELKYALRQYEPAIDNWKKYIQYSEDSPENTKTLINYIYLNKDYKAAADMINIVLQHDPNNTYMLHMLAYSYTQMNDYKNGIPIFVKYFSSAKDSEIIIPDYEYYSKLLTDNKQDSVAVIQLQKAVKMDTSRFDLHANIAVLCFKMKNWDCVISEYNSKLQMTGSLGGQEYFDLGRAYYFKGSLIYADSAFSKLIQAKPELIIGYIWRARINAQLDSTSEKGLAKPFYEKVISMAKSDSVKYKKDLIDAYHYLGYYFYLQKDECSAKINYQQVLFLAPDDQASLEAVKKLKCKEIK
jgi:tetratricopeptide (TPR) repeat protein